jgi:very-short-patch-repair endonuclease
MIAVEVDGRKWHSSPEARKRDAFKNHILKRLGWKVFRFWEEEILEKADECVEQVLQSLHAWPRDLGRTVFCPQGNTTATSNREG